MIVQTVLVDMYFEKTIDNLREYVVVNVSSVK